MNSRCDPFRVRAFARVLGSLLFFSLVPGCNEADVRYDFDDDGFEDAVDCMPEDPTGYPGAPDPIGDSKDQNCDGTDGIDVDSDGYPNPASSPESEDCDDTVPSINPGATEEPGNGIDEDCDGLDFIDEDGDGDPSHEDCDDTNPELHSLDTDRDTHSLCDGDCDDLDSGLNLLDLDQDQVTTCDGDCNDLASAIGPGFPEVCDNEAVDNDCDGSVSDENEDGDGDGFHPCGYWSSEGWRARDCNDQNVDVFPGNPEICDELDNDCNPETDEAIDGDADGVSVCDGDCLDSHAGVHPNAVELCDEQNLDEDCNGLADEDDPNQQPCSFVQIAAGAFHACATNTNAYVHCWGDNSFSQASPPSQPVQTVEAGAAASCALTEEGQAICWGSELYGQLDIPTDIDFASFSLGLFYGCGLDSSGNLSCWGDYYNSPGQLDVVTQDLEGPYSLFVATFNLACATSTVSAELTCFDSQGSGIANAESSFPDEGITDMGVGNDQVCLLYDTGDVYCAMRNDLNFSEMTAYSFESASSMAGGNDFICALMDEGYVDCAGPFDYEVCSQEPTGGGYIQISAGYDFACALHEDGHIDCWGGNAVGQSEAP